MRGFLLFWDKSVAKEKLVSPPELRETRAMPKTVQSILHNTRPNAVTSGYETSGALHARIWLIPPAASSMSFSNPAALG